MNDQLTTLAERVLALCDAQADAEVTVRAGRVALTRFANSFIHQNLVEQIGSVSLRLAYDARIATSTVTLDLHPSDEALRSLVTRTARAAHLPPADPEWDGPAPPAPMLFDGRHDPATAAASPDDRAEAVRDFVHAAEGLETAGFCETTSVASAFANSAGQRAVGHSTVATLDGVARTRGADSSARRSSAALADISSAELGRHAATRVRAGVDPIALPGGHYDVVLEPSCVANLLSFLAEEGFNGRAVNEGRSFLRPGARQFDERITLDDDPAGPARIGLPFDGEGTPKRRMELVRSGVSGRPVHDRRTGRTAGVTSTGHAGQGDEDNTGPIARNLVLAPGDRDLAALVAGLERGLLITDFWYTRVLDPRTLVVTGLTRNGVFLVLDGAITRPVANLRFTESYLDALAPGRVLAVGAESQLVRQGAGAALVPALCLSGWNFSGASSG